MAINQSPAPRPFNANGNVAIASDRHGPMMHFSPPEAGPVSPVFSRTFPRCRGGGRPPGPLLSRQGGQ